MKQNGFVGATVLNVQAGTVQTVYIGPHATRGCSHTTSIECKLGLFPDTLKFLLECGWDTGIGQHCMRGRRLASKASSKR